MTKFTNTRFGSVVQGSALREGCSRSKLETYAKKLEGMGYEIEVTTQDSFTAFLEDKSVIEADCVDLEMSVEKFTWNEYYGAE